MEKIGALLARATQAEATPAERRRAFGEVVRGTQDLAFGYAYTLLGDFDLAQDAAQEAFLMAWQELPRLRDHAAFLGWFKRIIHSQCRRLTRVKRPPTLPLEAAGQVVGHGDPNGKA